MFADWTEAEKYQADTGENGSWHGERKSGSEAVGWETEVKV